MVCLIILSYLTTIWQTATQATLNPAPTPSNSTGPPAAVFTPGDRTNDNAMAGELPGPVFSEINILNDTSDFDPVHVGMIDGVANNITGGTSDGQEA